MEYDPPNLGAYYYYETMIIFIIITIWLFNIAMENGAFIDGLPICLPIKNCDFPWLC